MRRMSHGTCWRKQTRIPSRIRWFLSDLGSNVVSELLGLSELGEVVSIWTGLEETRSVTTA